jgi:solute carrier family 29 (equilibrative nucleoside transporter) protein 4
MNIVAFFSNISDGMTARWLVAKNIWQYMVSICAAYYVTLSLYPGIISEIKRCAEDHWFPVLLMTLFNGTDLIGKVNKRSTPCNSVLSSLYVNSGIYFVVL